MEDPPTSKTDPPPGVTILITAADPQAEQDLRLAAERLSCHLVTAAPSEAAERAAEVAPAIVIIQVPSSGPDEALRRLLETCRSLHYQPALVAVVDELTGPMAEELLRLGVCAWLTAGDGLQQRAELLLANILGHLSRRHEKTRHLQILLEGVQEGVWLCDENQITTWVSERMASMLGYSCEEMIGRSVLEFVVPEERADQEAKVRDRSRGKHDVFVRHLRTRDGAIRSFLISARAVLDEAGNYEGSAAFFTDITDKEELAKALSLATNRLESVYRTAKVGIAHVQNRIFVEVNDALCSMLGRAREELKGSSTRIIFVDDDEYNRVGRDLYTPLAYRDVSTTTAKLLHREGRTIEALLTAAYIDPQNPDQGTTFTLQDITLLSRETQALKQYIELWRATMSAVPDSVFILDHEQNIVAANRATERLLGVPESRLIGRRCCEIIHATQGPPECCPFCAINSSGETRSVRMHEPRLGGWYDVTVTPLPVGPGGERHFLHVVRNVNELVTTSTRLERHVAWLRALVDLAARRFDDERELLRYALDQCVTLNGSELGLVFLPTGDTVDLKEFVWSEKVADVCAMQIPPSYSFSQAGVWADAIRTGRPHILNDYLHAPERKGLPKGHPPIRRHLAVPIVEDGKPVLLVGLANKTLPYDDEDVAQVNAFFTEVWQIFCRYRAEQELRQLNVQLEQRVQDQTAELRRAYDNLDSFVSNVSHDLNKRLGQVTMYLSAAKAADDAGPEARQDIETAYNAAEKLSEMMQGLLKLSRQTRSAVVRATVDLGELAGRCFRILQNEDPARNVEFRTSGDLTAFCDKVLAERVLDNLIGNAWKFTRDQDSAVIEVGAVERQGRRWFYVRDNGCGFDAASAEGLFLPFRRFDETGTYEGTGVGLSIVRRIIDAHNGDIQAESQRGAGATFYFHFGPDTPPA